MDNIPQEDKKSSFKKIIQKAIRSNRVIKTISFSLEERKVDVEKQHRKFVSPPPAVVIDNEDSTEEPNSDDDKENGWETTPLKPAPLIHSASFFSVKKQPDCPQTPSKKRKEKFPASLQHKSDEGFQK